MLAPTAPRLQHRFLRLQATQQLSPFQFRTVWLAQKAVGCSDLGAEGRGPPAPTWSFHTPCATPGTPLGHSRAQCLLRAHRQGPQQHRPQAGPCCCVRGHPRAAGGTARPKPLQLSGGHLRVHQGALPLPPTNGGHPACPSLQEALGQKPPPEESLAQSVLFCGSPHPRSLDQHWGSLVRHISFYSFSDSGEQHGQRASPATGFSQ